MKRRPAPRKRAPKRRIYRNTKGRFISRGRFYRAQGMRRKPSKRRLRAVSPLSGWESIGRWRAVLEARYPGLIYSENLPGFLRYANNSMGEAYLAKNKRMPVTRDIFRLASVWLVVENTKDDEFYLLIQTQLLAPSITGERLYDACRHLYQARSDAIEEKTDYLEVREWAAWSGGRV